MTVAQLIRKLNKLPQDALVVVENDRDYYDGTYKATDVEYWESDNMVSIGTDYKKLFDSI